jgi:hypothetical protein
MNREDGRIVETAIEARGARLGKPVLVVLVVSTIAVIALFALILLRQLRLADGRTSPQTLSDCAEGPAVSVISQETAGRSTCHALAFLRRWLFVCKSGGSGLGCSTTADSPAANRCGRRTVSEHGGSGLTG